jgi:hypothetical protein
MDGIADSPGYLLSSPGMTLHAALRGDLLYVATWAPGTAFNTDHFILVADRPTAGATAPSPWANAGKVAVPAGSPLLGAESSNSHIGWADTGGTAAESARAGGQLMEGTLHIAEAFGSRPANIYLAALAYQTADGGVPGAQAPARVADNGDVDPDELLVIPLEALRDEDANGIYDRLESGKRFVISSSGRVRRGSGGLR